MARTVVCVRPCFIHAIHEDRFSPEREVLGLVGGRI